jgi:DNA-binding NarL/FixJ family response regulator
MQPRVALADHHAMVLEALSALLQAECAIVGTFVDGAAALAGVLRLQPDILLLEVDLPTLGGIALVRELAATHPEVRCLFVTGHADPQRARAALAAGAQGYMLKGDSPEELVAGVHTVAAGGRHVSPQIEALLEQPGRGSTRVGAHLLTLRQQEVLARVAAGMAGKEIANDLGIALKTVEFHKARISQLLGLRSTAAMTRYAVEHGLDSMQKRD